MPCPCADFNGYYAACVRAAKVRDALDLIVEQARARKDYELSDFLRTLANTLDDAVGYPRPELRRKT